MNGSQIQARVEPKAALRTAADLKTSYATGVGLEGALLDKKLREKRSEAYIKAMTQLDGGGARLNHGEVDSLIAAISAEFPDLKPHQFAVGIISKCYLGEPYEVHTLDTRLEIIEHYKRGQPLPGGMERGRSLAMHPAYAFIEIYSDCMIAVASSGLVAVTKGGCGGEHR